LNSHQDTRFLASHALKISTLQQCRNFLPIAANKKLREGDTQFERAQHTEQSRRTLNRFLLSNNAKFLNDLLRVKNSAMATRAFYDPQCTKVEACTRCISTQQQCKIS
jgi:hypothetical protein